MTGIKQRSPTNKEFKTNFQGLASTRVKKGHLNNTQERKPGDTVIEKGILVRIDRKKLYQNGWEVKVGTDKDAKTYICSYGDGVMYIPDSTITKQYFVPKGKVEVELTIDKKNKIYTITKINTNNKKPVALYENLLTLSVDTDENSETDTAVEISNSYIKMKSDSVIISNGDGDEIDLGEENKTIKTELNTLSTTVETNNTETNEKVESLLQRIEILEGELNAMKEKESENTEENSNEEGNNNQNNEENNTEESNGE